METAIKVVYCPIDGLPPDFCQYGPSWDKSKPWVMENFPEYCPELAESLANVSASEWALLKEVCLEDVTRKLEQVTQERDMEEIISRSAEWVGESMDEEVATSRSK